MNRPRAIFARPALELIEEAVHLLRGAPVSALAAWCFGSLPFALAFLYFWMEMSRNASASREIAGESLLLALLFAWMKAWHVVFARLLKTQLAASRLPALDFGQWIRLIAVQTALHATGLFLLPLTLPLVLPFLWVYGFYQNLTAISADDPSGFVETAKKAWRQTGLFAGQNLAVLLVLCIFGFFVFINWCSVCLLLPALAKTILGIESAFSRSSFAMVNTTFIMAMFALTWLSLDPLIKAIYLLRCFYGQSRHSGEDLKAELKQFQAASTQPASLPVP